MASEEFRGEERRRFPALLAAGVLMAVVVVIVAFVVDSEIGIPLLVLLAICVAAAVGFRLISGSNRSADRDSSDAGLPKAEPDSSRPVGDTEQAHDEINPHDLPPTHPGRHDAEEITGGTEGTTRGPLP